MFKFTIPTKPNLYLDLYNYECVIRIVALSGGYETNKACELLKQNKNMIASFSRALLQYHAIVFMVSRTVPSRSNKQALIILHFLQKDF